MCLILRLPFFWLLQKETKSNGVSLANATPIQPVYTQAEGVVAFTELDSKAFPRTSATLDLHGQQQHAALLAVDPLEAAPSARRELRELRLVPCPAVPSSLRKAPCLSESAKATLGRPGQRCRRRCSSWCGKGPSSRFGLMVWFRRGVPVTAPRLSLVQAHNVGMAIQLLQDLHLAHGA